MKLVAISDMHGCLPSELPECDMLVIAGDVVPPTAEWDLQLQRAWLELDFAVWLRNIRVQTGCSEILGIAGNHDTAFEAFIDLGGDLPWTYLQDSWVVRHGRAFHGTPWTPGREDSRFAFHKTDDQMVDVAAMVPRQASVVIAHGPPYGICDLTSPDFDSLNVGSRAYFDLIDDVRPSAFICGHIHTGYGMAFRGRTRIYNAALCTDPPQYLPVHSPHEIRLDDLAQAC